MNEKSTSSRIRVRFTITPDDDRFDLLRFQLLSLQSKKARSNYLYESLIKGRFDNQNKFDIQNQNESVEVELNLSTRSYGLSDEYSKLISMQDHRARVIWLKRHLINLLNLSQNGGGVAVNQVNEIDQSNSKTGPSAGEIRSEDPPGVVSEEMRALNSRALEIFNM